MQFYVQKLQPVQLKVYNLILIIIVLFISLKNKIFYRHNILKENVYKPVCIHFLLNLMNFFY